MNPEKFMILPAAESVYHPQNAYNFLTENDSRIKLLIFWCRYHWTLLVKRPGNRNEVELYDSAKSEPVFRDVRRFVAPYKVIVMPTPQQQRGSLECGIFVLGFIYGIIHGLKFKTGTCSLERTRKFAINGENISERWFNDILDKDTLHGGAVKTTWELHDDLESAAASLRLCYLLSAVCLVKEAQRLLKVEELALENCEQLEALRRHLHDTQGKNLGRLQTSPEWSYEKGMERDPGETLEDLKDLGISPIPTFYQSLPTDSTIRVAIIREDPLHPRNFNTNGWIRIGAIRHAGMSYNEHQQDGESAGVEAYGGHHRWVKEKGQLTLYFRETSPPDQPQGKPPANTEVRQKRKYTTQAWLSREPVSIEKNRLRSSTVEGRLLNAKEGQGFVFGWSSDSGQATWWGKKLQETEQEPTLEVSMSACETCGEWREMDPFSVKFPVTGVVIHQAEVCDQPEKGCVCWCQAQEAPVEQEGVTPEQFSEAEIIQMTKEWDNLNELKPTGPLPSSATSHLKGRIGEQWFVYNERSARIPLLVWRELAESTRKAHIRWLFRIKEIDADLKWAPLGRAVVEMVLRMAAKRKWVWSTVASALSALASALRNLPIYTNQPQPIDLKTDPIFVAASRRAQKMARSAAPPSSLSDPMTVQTFNKVWNGLPHRSKLLLALCWHFASRVGDMRQVRARDITLPQVADDRLVRITFRFGKGGAFWGPYTIAAVLPDHIVKDVVALTRQKTPNEPMWQEEDQTALARKVAEEGLTLRSIRRGALLTHAQKGATTGQLQLLSGHRRLDTLQRYLGWGVAATTAVDAARQRGVLTGGDATEPRIMGEYSGFEGIKGRRIPPPVYFVTRPPSGQDLGIEHGDDTWEIHAKDVEPANVGKILEFASPEVSEQLRRALAFLEPTVLDRFRQSVRKLKDIPRGRFTAEQLDKMQDRGKIVHWAKDPEGTVNAFGVPETRKHRIRPIFEPFLNHLIPQQEIPRITYPSRLERRQMMEGMRYVIEFDFAAFFDQFALPEMVQGRFVFRDLKDRLWALTRLPMGATFSPAIAQFATWALTEGLNSDQVKVTTMIDNVRIAAKEAHQFVGAVKEFKRRCKAAGVQINDNKELSDLDLVRLGDEKMRGLDFLGEHCSHGMYSNKQELVEKLNAAVSHLGSSSTRRNIASVIGLCIFMTHTLNIALYDHFNVMRWYSRLFNTTGDNQWDEKIGKSWTSFIENEVCKLCTPLLVNKPVKPKLIKQPGVANSDYDMVIVIDASKTGWGAYVNSRQETWKLQQRFANEMRHSARAEPKAVELAIAWAKQQGAKRIAMVTDHIALVQGQRRWWSGYGGSSTAYYLNNAYKEAYTEADTEFYYVEGTSNPADQPSRTTTSTTLTISGCNSTFPQVGDFLHPFINRPPCRW